MCASARLTYFFEKKKQEEKKSIFESSEIYMTDERMLQENIIIEEKLVNMFDDNETLSYENERKIQNAWWSINASTFDHWI